MVLFKKGAFARLQRIIFLKKFQLCQILLLRLVGCLYEGGEEWVWGERSRLELRMKLHTDEERMYLPR